MYTALYRAERPEVFEEILGQEHIVKILRHQIAADTVGHAYLFCGTRGTGKTTTARILAKGVNCTDPDTAGRPCGRCASCKAISEGSFMDVVEIDAASNNGVDNIRELRESVKYPPAIGRKKVYIIDEVHMLSAGAFNALLKTLEEPPENVMFILATTEPQKLPATILSRCMKFDFKRVPQQLIMDGMKRICDDRAVEISEAALKLLANCADGSVRDGLSVLDQVLAAGDKKIDREKVLEYIGTAGEDFFIELTEKVSVRNVSEAIILVDEALADGKDVRGLMRDWMAYYRNLMITKFVRNPEELLNMSIENIKRIKEQSDHISLEEINSAIMKLAKAINDARQSTQPRILLELAVVNIASDGIAETATPFTSAPPLSQHRQPTPQAQPTWQATEPPAVSHEVPRYAAQSPSSPTSAQPASQAEPFSPPAQPPHPPQSGTPTEPAPPSTPTAHPVSLENERKNNDMLWHRVFEEGEDEAGSFNIIRTGTELYRVSEKNFIVAAKTNFAKKYAELQRERLEAIMADKLGRHVQMICCLESELEKHAHSGEEPKSEPEDDRKLAEEASRILGIEIEID